ncbi:hypothetical protein OnM2_027090, partial [Erysiphe neolycopersici]
MLGTLPRDKKCQVEHWFETGGPEGTYNWPDFLDHFKELFYDKQSLLIAGKELSLMRQGTSQPFGEFLRQYEQKLTHNYDFSSSGNPKQTVISKDSEGDVIMTGINTLVAILKTTAFNNKNGTLAGTGKPTSGGGNDNRPRAPWRTQQEYQKLISD